MKANNAGVEIDKNTLINFNNLITKIGHVPYEGQGQILINIRNGFCHNEYTKGIALPDDTSLPEVAEKKPSLFAPASATARMNAPCRIATRSALANLPTHRSPKPSKAINNCLTSVCAIFARPSYYLCSQVCKSRKLFVTLHSNLRLR